MTEKRDIVINTSGIAERGGKYEIGATVFIPKDHKTPQGKKCDQNQGTVQAPVNNGKGAIVSCICGTSLTI